MTMEFCSDLQLEWVVESISLSSLNDVKIVLDENKQEEVPKPTGRSGKDVLSWPTIYTHLKRVEFYFSNCVYFNVREDRAPGLSENDKGEGKTFQRLLESELLQLHSDRMINELYHFRIIGREEIIDILSHETPNIVKTKNT